MITTALGPAEQRQHITNPELNQLIQEVRAATGENWCVGEIIDEHVSWWGWRVRIVKRYQLLVEVGGFLPFQVINFYRDQEKTAINTYVSAELVIAFLYGILAGVKQSRKQQDV